MFSISLKPNGSEKDTLRNVRPLSHIIQPPRLAESPVAFECRTLQIMPVGEFHIVIGQVVHLFVRDDMLSENNRIDVDQVGALGRMAGYAYCRTGDLT